MYLKDTTDTLSFNLIQSDDGYRWYCTWEFAGSKYGINTYFTDQASEKISLDWAYEAYKNLYQAQQKGNNRVVPVIEHSIDQTKGQI